MIQESLIKKVEIEFEGILRKEIGTNHHWVESEIPSSFQNRKIANAAIQAGYKVGETFKYKIIIEPRD